MARYQPEQDIVFLRGKFEELEAELVPSHRISPEVLLNKLENETPQLAVKRVFLTHKRLALALCAGFVCCIALMYAGTQRGRLFTAGSAVSPENSGLSIMERMAQEQPQQADQSEAFAKDVDYAGVRKALSAVSVDSSDYDMPTVSAEETTGGGGPETDGSSLQGNSGVLTAARTDTGGADIIETDGSYLYYATGPSVMIAGIAQDGAITFSSEIKVSGEDRYVIELYQRGNSLTLLCNDYSFTVAKADENTGKTAQVQSVGTTVETYDVTDRSNPVRVREFTQEGEYRSSLVSEDTLYIVSERKTFAYADVLPVDAIVPSVYDSAAGGEKGGAKLISSTDIVLRDEPKSSGYVTVSALALDDDTATVRTRAVLGGAQEIYCAKSGVYLLDTVSEGGALYTDIMKLSFAAGGSVQVLRTRLAGELLGGMDERNGSLRLATKTQESDGADAAQISLHVLDGSLSVTGSAPWSQAPRSTGSMYYVGDTAYVGAADEGALLAAFDLSDPHEPRLVQPTGIQTLPDALVPLSDTLAAGISCTAGDTAGLRVSLYRTQGDSPKQLTSLLLGEDGSYCEATRTAGALLYDAKEGILGFPAMVTADSGAQSMQKEFGGYYVFRVSDESLTLAGRIEGDSFDPGDEIRRGVCVNGILYTASERTITSVDVGTLSLIDTLQWKS